MKRKIIPLAGMYIIVILFVICVLSIITEDNKPPTIIFGEEEIAYVEGEDTQILLSGVTAVDEEDGDVSNTLAIESIRVLASGRKANVIYAAKDSQNNVVKESRIVKYQAAEEQQPIAVITETPENPEITKEPESSDTNETTLDLDGASQETIAAADATQGDTEAVQEEPLVSTGDPIIKLKTNSVTIKAGDYFNVMNYIETVVDDKDDVWRRIYINGEYDSNTPGTYKIRFSVTDTDGNTSNYEYLTLTVQ